MEILAWTLEHWQPLATGVGAALTLVCPPAALAWRRWRGEARELIGLLHTTDEPNHQIKRRAMQQGLRVARRLLYELGDEDHRRLDQRIRPQRAGAESGDRPPRQPGPYGGRVDDGPRPHLPVPQRRLVNTAADYLGVREQGENAGPAVERFQRAVDGKAAGEPWCAAFVLHCLAEVDARADTQHAIHPSEHVRTIWERTPRACRAERPAPGRLMVWAHANADGSLSDRGHIGIVEAVSGAAPDVTTIEGNTGPEDGDGAEGVHRRLRSVDGEGTLRVLGYLDPWPRGGRS